MSNAISANVSGNVVNASVSGSPASASVTSSQVSSVQASSGPSTSPVLSVNGQIGNVVLPVFPSSFEKPPGMARLVTVLDGGTFLLSARSTTGRFAVLWWDGSVQVFGGGAASQYTAASKVVPASGNWAGSAPKPVVVWSCTASPAASGSLTGLSCTSKKVISIAVDGCQSLTEISCDTNQLANLLLTGCAALQTVSCHLNVLRELVVSDCVALTNLYCQGNLLSGLDVSKNTSLLVLSCSENALGGLDVTQNTALESMYCHNNQITALNVNGKALLRNVNASNNLLTSVRAIGVATSGAAGFNVSSNSLSSQALNALYADLAGVASGTIYVAGNPGAALDNPAVATAKGYTVNG